MLHVPIKRASRSKICVFCEKITCLESSAQVQVISNCNKIKVKSQVF